MQVSLLQRGSPLVRGSTATSANVRVPLRIACVARPHGASAAASRSASDDGLRPEATAMEVSSNVWLSGGLLALAPLLLDVQDAAAAGGAYGLLEGRSAALLHPAMMFGLLASSLYAAYLGWQWRRVREVGEEIRALKAALPAPTPDAPAPPNPVLEEKEAVRGLVLQRACAPRSGIAREASRALGAPCLQERKRLVAGNFRDKHSAWGSLLLAAGVGIAIEGCANTFMRTGKLFPGPHLYAGGGACARCACTLDFVDRVQRACACPSATITCAPRSWCALPGAAIVFLWAFAAALTPAMQKGDQNARNLHIAANCLNIGLFLWQVRTAACMCAEASTRRQGAKHRRAAGAHTHAAALACPQVPTGLEIVGKVFQFTQWP